MWSIAKLTSASDTPQLSTPEATPSKTVASRPYALSALLLGAAISLSACGGGWVLKGSQDAVAEKKKTIPSMKAKEFAAVVPTEEQSQVFMADGKAMCFSGTNNYYLIFKNELMIDSVFANMKKMNLNVMRHWGHLEAGSLDGKVPHLKDDGTKEGVYFQYWDTATGKPAYNEGKDGLQRLDLLVKKAKDNNVKLVLTLTNNWPDFGGMDQMLLWYGLHEHPKFYTDARVRQAYKDWVEYLLNRTNTLTGEVYKNDPTIFAWELANEPRSRNYTSFDSAEGWDSTTITTWAREMSDFIRTIDPYHMIAVGDEGMFADGGKSFYDGSDGLDHKALLALENIDYGTFHLYPDHWGTGFTWADGWIEDHLVAARKAGKPTVLEEYGVMVGRDDKTFEINYNWEFREKVYHQWNSLMQQRGGAGTMFWMIAGHDDYLKRNYTDYDHFTIYDTDKDPSARLIKEYSDKVMTDSTACQLAEGLVPKREVPEGFVTVSMSPPAALAAPAEAAPAEAVTPEPQPAPAEAPAPSAYYRAGSDPIALIAQGQVQTLVRR